MGIRFFKFEDGLDPRNLSASGWGKKDCCEIYHFVLAFKGLEPELTETFGKIVSFDHRNDGDDPPDIMVTFEKGELGFEMTELLTTNLGHFNNIIKRSGRASQGGIVPSPTKIPLNDRGHVDGEKAIDYAFDIYGQMAWSSVEADFKAWFEAAFLLYKKKVIKAQDKKIDYVILFNTEFGTPLKEIAEGMRQAVLSANFKLPHLIIHDRLGINEFDSWVVKKGDPVQTISQHPAGVRDEKMIMSLKGLSKFQSLVIRDLF